ncbi:hypothetical protein CTAYLR_010396 [Chrysophaeum taylorii]|uniref:Lariat debranching enzyme C-terminal domain-containing protein n=1 Tax=Chrysophaeum taylorii TaxID=2483200 RepID=A0AAD7UMI2_9STRA|nr:hypothetical protein CTAYLR_010396 [Chrysophaeum taylorii]
MSSSSSSLVNVVVEGCCHGSLDEIYETVREIERRRAVKADLLLLCGDFQGLRVERDLEALAVPSKYRKLGGFGRYYRGEAEALCLTILVGGNHEASNALGALYYGGWVARRIYYLGAAGVVSFRGLRIAGLSGIYNRHHYHLHHFETTAARGDDRNVRSAYHVREIDVFRLALLANRPDVFLSHDWPRGVERWGNLEKLLQEKPFFREDVQRGQLGSPANELLLRILKPRRWFSAHLHCKFAALVTHDAARDITTSFLALDKCLPRRDFLQLVTLEGQPVLGDEPDRLYYDAEWIAILRKTHGIDGALPPPATVPIPQTFPRVAPEDLAAVRALDLRIPTDFAPLPVVRVHPANPLSEGNPQTDRFLAHFGLPHVVTTPYAPPPPPVLRTVVDPNAIALDDEEEEEEEEEDFAPPGGEEAEEGRKKQKKR